MEQESTNKSYRELLQHLLTSKEPWSRVCVAVQGRADEAGAVRKISRVVRMRGRRRREVAPEPAKQELSDLPTCGQAVEPHGGIQAERRTALVGWNEAKMRPRERGKGGKRGEGGGSV